MTDMEVKQWMAVTENSRYQWTEDEITRLNGRGALYYFGGEDGIYIQIEPEGELSIGTYERAIPTSGRRSLPRKPSLTAAILIRHFKKPQNWEVSGFCGTCSPPNRIRSRTRAPPLPVWKCECDWRIST